MSAFHCHSLAEIVCQKQYVVTALAKRRDEDDLEAQAVQKVFLELAFAAHLSEISIGRPDYPYICFMRNRGSDPFIGSVFDDPENLLLDLHGDVSDFVQKQGSALSLLEAALSGLVCSGEGSLLVAEEFAFDQCGR